MKSIKSLTFLVVTAFFAVSVTAPSSFAQSLQVAPAVSASEAVFYAHGIVAAQGESVSTTTMGQPALGGAYSFRVLAFLNYTTASMFFDLPIAAAYFRGKADAFRDLADFYGEP